MFSSLISARLPISVTLEGVRWKPLAGVRFNKFTAGGVQGKGWISLDGRIYLSELSLSPDFLRSLPSLSPEPGFKPDKEALRFEGALFHLENLGSAKRVRIIRMQSAQLEIRGSVCWEGGRLEKASLAGLLSASLAERLPKHWRQRLPSATGGKKMLKCAHKNNRLTFYGASGPLLRATWLPDSSE